MKVAVPPLTAHVPATDWLALELSVTEMFVAETGLMFRLKTITICAVLLTPAAPFTGLYELAPNPPVIGVVMVPVAKVLEAGVTEFPSGSWNPLTETEYTVAAARLAAGVNVRVWLSGANATSPAITFVPALTEMALCDTVPGLMGTFAKAVTTVFTGTPVEPVTGLSETVGAEVTAPEAVVKQGLPIYWT